jgi:hypothetical protein
MAAVMQPRIVKVSVPAIPSKGTQSNSQARVLPEKNSGQRFFKFLMLALAAPAA